MRLLAYYDNEAVVMGVATAGGVLPGGISAQAFYAQGQAALPALRQRLAAANSATVDQALMEEGRLRLAPLVPNPGKIVCVGLNYRQHAREFGKPEPETPILFGKYNNTLAAHGEPVPLAAEWQHVDYEAELGVVIGRRAWRVSPETALDHVLGYCCANDISERELQKRTDQWLLGKTMDKFLPLGPYLVTTDDVPDPQALTIRGWLNDDLRQDSATGDMIFSVAQIIAYASRYFPLDAGDVILTGTPEGVSIGRADGAFMQPGDTFTVEIEGLGRLSNRMVALD